MESYGGVSDCKELVGVAEDILRRCFDIELPIVSD
jgi:hypothetical protein